jgi:hypothetical protein
MLEEEMLVAIRAIPAGHIMIPGCEEEGKATTQPGLELFDEEGGGIKVVQVPRQHEPCCP